jgi:DNA-binding Lrp family transcriptional regulator
VKPLFVQIKCELSRTTEVAERIVDSIAELSEIYSTSGAFDLLAKFYLENDQDPGDFVSGTLHKIEGIRDTYTIMAFRLFVAAPIDGLGDGG